MIRGQQAFAAAALVAIAGAAAWTVGAPLLDQFDGAIAACESVIRDRLTSPSSYRRVTAEFTSRGPLQLDEFRERAEKLNCPVQARSEACESATPTADALVQDYIVEQELERLGIRSATQKQRKAAAASAVERTHEKYLSLDAETIRTGFVLLECDAANSFGAVIRSNALCRFGPVGEDGLFEASDVFAFGEVPRSEAEAAREVQRD